MTNSYEKLRALMVAQYLIGQLGNENNPSLKNSFHQDFWLGYSGKREPEEHLTLSLARACVEAGKVAAILDKAKDGAPTEKNK